MPHFYRLIALKSFVSSRLFDESFEISVVLELDRRTSLDCSGTPIGFTCHETLERGAHMLFNHSLGSTLVNTIIWLPVYRLEFRAKPVAALRMLRSKILEGHFRWALQVVSSHLNIISTGPCWFHHWEVTIPWVVVAVRNHHFIAVGIRDQRLVMFIVNSGTIRAYCLKHLNTLTIALVVKPSLFVLQFFV